MAMAALAPRMRKSFAGSAEQQARMRTRPVNTDTNSAVSSNSTQAANTYAMSAPLLSAAMPQQPS